MEPPEGWEDREEADADPTWPDAATIDPRNLPAALRRLTLLGDDPFLSMQATNIGLVDVFLNRLESRLMRARVLEDGTPENTLFVAAQAQMWIFAAYELLRTWRQRVTETQRQIRHGLVEARLAELEQPLPYRHTAREMRATQLRALAARPEALDLLDADLRRVHTTFAIMEALRMSLAKHEVAKVKKSVAHAPGYGRINPWNGSIDFEISTEIAILQTTNHRELAEGLRRMWDDEPQSWDELKSFDEYIRGPSASDV